MENTAFGLVLSAWVFFIYGAICIICVIFTFAFETYYKINNTFNLIVFNFPIFITVLDRIYIDCLDVWMERHNKIVGPFLIALSLIEMQSGFNIINQIIS